MKSALSSRLAKLERLGFGAKTREEYLASLSNDAPIIFGSPEFFEFETNRASRPWVPILHPDEPIPERPTL